MLPKIAVLTIKGRICPAPEATDGELTFYGIKMPAIEITGSCLPLKPQKETFDKP